MQIEEGKFYKNRDGDKVGPMTRVRLNYGGPYKWRDEFCLGYRDDGGFLDVPHDADLIEEWEEPTTEADEGWGPWEEGTSLLEGQTHMFDYREECINGVWRWQSRPRKPVVEWVEVYVPGEENPRGEQTHKIFFKKINGVIDCSSIKMEPF